MGDNTVAEHDRIQTEYAGFSAVSDATKKIKAVSDTIKMPRPHVQPNPVNKDREKILRQPNMAVIQTALFTILIALIELVLIPPAYATNVMFLTLCVGASVGIYLSSR
jgi:hypothetical protein